MRALLFRLLLCMTLLLHGIGSAQASLHVLLGATANDVAADATPAGDATCPHAATTAAPPAAPAPAERACMELCLDLSLQTPQALVAATAAPTPVRPQAAPATRVPTGPATRAGPPPLRPPIAA